MNRVRTPYIPGLDMRTYSCLLLLVLLNTVRADIENLSRLSKLARVTHAQDTQTGYSDRRGWDRQDNGDGNEVEHNFYPSRREIPLQTTKPTATIATLPSSASLQDTTKPGKTSKPGMVVAEPTPKPTKYHYYPHNQHIYLLPECAIQQVCNAVYVRLNYTQPLCACPSRKEPCSASLNTDDLHTTELVTANTGKVLTLVKTCEPVAEMRICRAPRDWSLLALQNIRTGKSHYLVICRCPNNGRLDGPMSHDQPAYASVPGIRVYGMMCVRDSYRISRPYRYRRSVRGSRPRLPWSQVRQFHASVKW